MPSETTEMALTMRIRISFLENSRAKSFVKANPILREVLLPQPAIRGLPPSARLRYQRRAYSSPLNLQRN